jgi:hypothetical protein
MAEMDKHVPGRSYLFSNPAKQQLISFDHIADPR